MPRANRPRALSPAVCRLRARFRRHDTLEAPSRETRPLGPGLYGPYRDIAWRGLIVRFRDVGSAAAATATGRRLGSVDSAAVAESSPDTFYGLPREGIDWASTRVKLRRATFHPPERCTRTSS
jgi:hypothetical protein